eukprot:3116123-Karenia_brevis.AAC.1
MVRSFPRGSAAGPSGLRAQHLADAPTKTEKGQVLEQLCAAVQLLARGEAPDALAPHLAGASLLALEKKDGGLRPVAVGEVLRRLTA